MLETLKSELVLTLEGALKALSKVGRTNKYACFESA